LYLVNAAKQKLFKEEFIREKMGEKYFVHPSSVIDEDVKIGNGTKIWHFSHVMPGAKIGDNCILGQNVFVGPGVEIGNGCKIQNNVSAYQGIKLEDGVFCGPSMVFTNILTPRAFLEKKEEFLETVVRKGASIGANATIICGNTIGEYSCIGAGSVVTKNVPNHGLIVGVPGKLSGWVCECGEILTKQPNNLKVEQIKCVRCNLKYSFREGVFQKIQ
tara:strand:- start:3366 stop:4016 length:651 start_codon:yes stop_codon:yes gene_type:complete